jgi:hypothetical protein
MKQVQPSTFATIRQKMWIAMVSARSRDVRRVLQERGLDK